MRPSPRCATLLGLGALLGTLLPLAPASAQEPVPTCAGKPTTMVADQWDLEDPDDQFIDGTPGADVIVVHYPTAPLPWSPTVRGLGGNDTICILGDTPPDMLWGMVLDGGSGDDVLYAGNGRTHSEIPELIGDTLHGGAGDDILYGGPGSDGLNGGAGDDVLYGRQGDDGITGDSGIDTIHAGQGDDYIDAGTGDDTVFGGPGRDLIHGNLGRDVLFGGGGNDILSAHLNLRGSTSSTFEVGHPYDEPFGIDSQSQKLDVAGSRMFGGAGNDLLVGSNRWDRIQGGVGDDVILGLEGRDWIRGGHGNDLILGGRGVDDVNGNQGADEIVMIGQDTGHGGSGQDGCFRGPGSAGFLLRSCETVTTAGSEWTNIEGRVLSTIQQRR